MSTPLIATPDQSISSYICAIWVVMLMTTFNSGMIMCTYAHIAEFISSKHLQYGETKSMEETMYNWVKKHLNHISLKSAMLLGPITRYDSHKVMIINNLSQAIAKLHHSQPLIWVECKLDECTVPEIIRIYHKKTWSVNSISTVT